MIQAIFNYKLELLLLLTFFRLSQLFALRHFKGFDAFDFT